MTVAVLKHKRTIDDIWPMKNKKVLIRVDFNVPIKNGIISNDYRIRSSLPTIKKVVDQGGSVILISHLGRPKGLKYEAIERNNESKRRELQTWMRENGLDNTAFFAILREEDKMKILCWSSKANEANDLSLSSDKGKTALFSTLPEEEKSALIGHFNSGEKLSDVQLNHLRTHQGFTEVLSLEPIANRLSEILHCEVIFAKDCLDADMYVRNIQPGQILLLENVRFYCNEGSTDEEDRMSMANKLASYADYFVSDAFGAAHRNSATMTSIPKLMGHGVVGYLMAQEVNAFSQILGCPPRPMVAIIGGAKVSDKITLLESMLERIDKLIIGGSMAYTFLQAQGFDIGNTFHEVGQSFTEAVQRLLDLAKSKGIDVFLPIDHVCHTKYEATEHPLITEDPNVPGNYMALDIGPKSFAKYASVIAECNTAVWYGPVGVFEIDTYATGTSMVAEAMAKGTSDRGMLSIIGGGDSAIAVEKSGFANKMSHISTGGGASLALLEGKLLPGLVALDDA